VTASSSPQKDPKKILIVGVGNLLLKDEGVGVHAVRALERTQLPPGVDLCDGGVAGITLLDFFEKSSRVLLIDAAEMSLPPGTIRRFTPDEVQQGPEAPRFSSHDVGLLEVLRLAEALGRSPEEVVIIGIQPKEIAWGEELSSEVAAALPVVLEMVRREIKRMQSA
jgi:hydrogenase maturation protease